jgi:molybdate transport system regulatory protein
MTVPETAAIALQGAVWMTVGGAHLGGASRVALLEKIGECGSISQAAKAIKMSYKAAWDAIDNMNHLAGEALVERLTGGKGGGGTRLTARGQQLIDNFKIIARAHQHFIEQMRLQEAGVADDFLVLSRMSMKTSARNQFMGTVTAIKRGAVNDEVTLAVAGGQQIIAIVTRDSTDELALQPGAQAFALIQASAIILMVGSDGLKVSARNQMRGTVMQVKPGAVNTEVILALADGGTLAVTITNDSVASLMLAEGMAATGLFKASSVILAVPA